jgi:glycosyltransferase involved in cell wall biosynthesis
MINNLHNSRSHSTHLNGNSQNKGKRDQNGRSAKKLSILLVTPLYLPHIGGTEIHTYEVARRFASAGHDVTVLTTDLEGNLSKEELTEGFRIKRVPAWPRHKDYFFAPGIYHYIVDHNWDVIHCQSYHTLVPLFAIRAALRKNIPYFITFHSGGHSSWLRSMMRPVQRIFLHPFFAQAKGLIGVSKWEVDFFQKHLHLPLEKFYVTPNGYQLPDTKDLPEDLPKEGKLILSIGRIEKFKGHHRLVEALPYVIEKCPTARLRIVGSGPFEKTLWKIANQKGVAEHVEIQAVPGGRRKEMAMLLLQSDLVVLLSNYESQSISAMEALALNRPLLVSHNTALGELAEKGWATSVPPSSTAEEIAAAILNQLNRPIIPVTAALPTWDDCAQKILSLYFDVLSGE